jgi:hypothetical protein
VPYVEKSMIYVIIFFIVQKKVTNFLRGFKTIYARKETHPKYAGCFQHSNHEV